MDKLRFYFALWSILYRGCILEEAAYEFTFEQ